MSVVIDANLVVSIILPLPYSDASRNRIAIWKQTSESIIAPALWEYELISALRRAVYYGMLEADHADAALEWVGFLNLESIPPSQSLHKSALGWAERLGQARAYDAQYLALAEQAGAELWTGDKRLANSALQSGIDWVHWVGEQASF